MIGRSLAALLLAVLPSGCSEQATAPPDAGAPPGPSDVSVIFHSGDARVTWTARNTGADSWEVLRSDVGWQDGFEVVGTVTEPLFIEPLSNLDGAAWYAVREHAGGRWSARSNVFSFTTAGQEHLRVTNEDAEHARLEWDPVPGAEGFQLWTRREAGEGGTFEVDQPAWVRFGEAMGPDTASGVVERPWGGYGQAVILQATAGSSGIWASNETTVFPVDGVTEVGLAPGDGAVRVQWRSDLPRLDGQPASEFAVYRDGDEVGRVSAEGGGEHPKPWAFLDPGAPNGQAHAYQVAIVGPGGQTGPRSPAASVTPSPWVAVGGPGGMVCAASAEGQVYCASGVHYEASRVRIPRRGDGSVVVPRGATAVLGEDGTPLSGVTDVSSGELRTCAISEGAVVCWGLRLQSVDNEYRTPPGQEEDPFCCEDLCDLVAVPVPGPDGAERFEGATAVGVGSLHACAIQEGGGLYCWGDNQTGQLGLGATDAAMHYVPEPVLDEDGAAPLAGVEDLQVYGSRTCVVRDGGVLCWGANGYGDAGVPWEGDAGRKIPLPSPVMTDPGQPLTGVRALAQGSAPCAVDEDHGVWCWGYNVKDPLGTPSDGYARAQHGQDRIPVAELLGGRGEGGWGSPMLTTPTGQLFGMRRAGFWNEIVDVEMVPPEDGRTRASWGLGFCMVTRAGPVGCRANDGQRGYEVSWMRIVAEDQR